MMDTFRTLKSRFTFLWRTQPRLVVAAIAGDVLIGALVALLVMPIF